MLSAPRLRGSGLPATGFAFDYDHFFDRQGVIQSFENFRSDAKQVWQRAEVVAAEATEIWLIGYSIWEADFPYLLRLLRTPKNCDKIVIQNPYDADRIQEKFRTRARDIADKLEVYRQPF